MDRRIVNSSTRRDVSQQTDFLRQERRQQEIGEPSQEGGGDNNYALQFYGSSAYEGGSMNTSYEYQALHHQPGMEGVAVENSAPRLVEQYQFLLRSERYFLPLSQESNSSARITLEDISSWPMVHQSVYDASSHTIGVRLNDNNGRPRPAREVRRDIIIELYNARNRSIYATYNELARTFVEPGPHASQVEKDSYDYDKAIYALANEWFEWANGAETDLRIQLINADPLLGRGRGGREHVARLSMAETNDFVRHLQRNHSWHTIYYDAKAANNDWMGWRILAGAQENADPRSFVVTQQEIEDWQRGGCSTAIKLPSANPFEGDIGWHPANDYYG